MKITICSSMQFFPEFSKLKNELESFGHEVFAPEQRVEMPLEFGGGKTSIRGFFESQGGVNAFGADHDIWKAKSEAIRAHFDKVDGSDAILVTNYPKKGIDGYIGGNTFLEMGYAFATNKKIFVLFDLPIDSPYKEELLGLLPILINGKLNLIK